MATSMWKSTANILRRFISLASIKRSGTLSNQEYIHKGKCPVDDCELPGDLGQAVGIEREELKEIEAGNYDPFQMNVHKRTKGTFDEPTIVYSVEKKRMIGCICTEDSIFINWMNVYKGEPKRCECGHWFKVVSPPHDDSD